MMTDNPASGSESNGHEEAVWPDGPVAPPRPRVLTGAKSLVFYFLNLIFLAAVVFPLLVIEPFALWGLSCFLYRHPGMAPLRIAFELGICLTILASVWAAILIVSVWMYRKWLDRFGRDEFTSYLFHNRLQRMGTIGLKLNSFLLRQARK